MDGTVETRTGGLLNRSHKRYLLVELGKGIECEMDG
jgi:hypothetical protein